MKKKIVSLLFFLLLLFSLSSSVVFGSCETICSPGTDCSPPYCDTCSWCIVPPDTAGKIVNPILPGLSDLSGEAFWQKGLTLAISLTLTIGSLFFFFTLLTGAIKWMSGGGEKAQLESAQKQITHAFVGLAILFTSFAIINLIEYLFGISIIKFSLPTL